MVYSCSSIWKVILNSFILKHFQDLHSSSRGLIIRILQSLKDFMHVQPAETEMNALSFTKRETNYQPPRKMLGVVWLKIPDHFTLTEKCFPGALITAFLVLPSFKTYLKMFSPAIDCSYLKSYLLKNDLSVSLAANSYLPFRMKLTRITRFAGTWAMWNWILQPNSWYPLAGTEQMQYVCLRFELASLACCTSLQQYLFADDAVNFTVSLLCDQKADRVLCVGAPR
jgi:hypothetical protein